MGARSVVGVDNRAARAGGPLDAHRPKYQPLLAAAMLAERVAVHQLRASIAVVAAVCVVALDVRITSAVRSQLRFVRRPIASDLSTGHPVLNTDEMVCTAHLAFVDVLATSAAVAVIPRGALAAAAHPCQNRRVTPGLLPYT